MKFICLIDNLKEAVGAAEKIAFKKTALPILENILIKTKDKRIEIISTDLELSFNATVQGKVEKEGSLLVPARTFLSFLNSFPEEKIILEKKEGSLSVESENLKTNFPIQDPESYPPIPEVKTKNQIEIDAEHLIKTLNRSLISISTQDFKPEFGGVLFRINNEVKMVTTDGARLSENTIFQDYFKIKNQKVNIDFILPRKTAQFLTSAFKPEEKNIKVFIDDNQVKFETDKKTVTSRLIDGKFPPYEEIVPSSFKTTALVDKNKILSALKMANVFTSRFSEVKVRIQPKEKIILINSQNELQGTFEKKLPSKIDGEEVEINFNNSFLMAGIESLASGEITFGFNESNQPVLIKNSSEPGYFYILMPLRV